MAQWMTSSFWQLVADSFHLGALTRSQWTGAGVPEGQAKRYRRQATRLRELANQVDSPNHRADLERLAQKWDETAEKLERAKRRRTAK